MRFDLLASLLAFFLALGITGTATAGPGLGDTDGDGVDDFFDNCLTDVNGAQVDADYDGCGNYCDGDFDQSGTTGGSDFIIFRGGFLASASGVTDMDGSGSTGGSDFILFRGNFLRGSPGPSSNTFKDPVACP